MTAMNKNAGVWFFVPVNPEPWAVGPLQVKRVNGKMIPFMGRNTQLASFQESVRESLRTQWSGDLIEDDVVIEVFFWRTLSEYKTARGSKKQKHYVDATNMQKALEDALQGVVIKNDNQCVSVTSHIMDQSDKGNELIVIRLLPVFKEAHLRDIHDDLPEFVKVEISNSLESAKFVQSNLSWGSDDDF